MSLLVVVSCHSLACRRTIDTGGAGPITALLEARRMILNEHCSCVAVVAGACSIAHSRPSLGGYNVYYGNTICIHSNAHYVAGDAVASMATDEFLSRADAGCRPELATGAQALPSPVIPHGCAHPVDIAASSHTAPI
jgi:hypothetical protein